MYGAWTHEVGRKKGNITNFYNLFYYFVIYALLGWVLEVVFAYIKRKKFVNRGFIYGPFCPIYGVGIVSTFLIVEGVTRAFYNSGQPLLLIVFLITMIWTTLLEGVTGAIMNGIFYIRWWDYSDRFLNIKGYVCLEFSVLWGVFGTIAYKYFHVWLIKFVDYMPRHIGEIFLVILVIYFFIDIIFTIKSLINFKKLLLELEATSEEYILSKCRLITEMQNMKERISDRLENKVKRQSVESNVLTDSEILRLKEKFEFKEIENRYEKLAKLFSYCRPYNIFPDMKSVRFHDHIYDCRQMLVEDDD